MNFKEKKTEILLSIISIILLALYFLGLDKIFTPYLEKSGLKTIEIIVFLLLAFYIVWIQFFEKFGTEKVKILIGFFLILIIHILSFDSALNNNGDNASYIINAMSLVDRGGFYFLYLPIEKLDLSAAVGLPLALAPLYALFDVDIFLFKLVPFLMTLASFYFIFKVFEKHLNKKYALIIAILSVTNSYFTAFSSIVMTEMPYVFWSFLMFFAFNNIEEKWTKYDFIFIVSIFMTYATRAIGVGILPAFGVYLLFNKNIQNSIKKIDFRALFSEKMVHLFLISSFFVLFWNFRGMVYGVGDSQSSTLLSMNLTKQLFTNLGLIKDVAAQTVFSSGLIRFSVDPLSFLWIFISFLVLFGFVLSLKKKEFIGFYTFFVILVLSIGNVATQHLVMGRYLIVFIPIFIYFIILAIDFSKKFMKENFSKKIIFVFSFFLLASNLSGTAFNISQAKKENLYNPAYKQFLESAKWAQNNLPENSVIASRKERIFYIFSKRKGFKHTGYRDRLTKDGIEKILSKIKRNKTDYLVLDTFNGTSVRVMYPIIKQNPDKFVLKKVFGNPKRGACYLFEVKSW
jgi:hypothetical protein